MLLGTATYDVRRCYLEQLSDHAEKTGFTKPCQELYDSYVSRADTPDLRFQLFHTVRLVDKEAGTRAFMPEGNLYNEPEIPSSYEAESAFQTVAFPIIDGSVDIGHLIRRAENEMEYLQLSASTGGQYMKAGSCIFLFISAAIRHSPETDAGLSLKMRIRNIRMETCTNGRGRYADAQPVYYLKLPIQAVLGGSCFVHEKYAVTKKH